MRFPGSIAIVTGGANGIGRCLVEALLAKEATVWAWDLDEVALESMARDAKRYGRNLRTEVVDVTDETAVGEACGRVIAEHKRIDLWLNNAGIAGLGGFLEMKPADFRRVIDINLGALITGTRVALGHMEARGAGTIVNMASVAGHIAPPYMSAYAATKHAVVGFTRALREEMKLRDSPVRIVMVSPGFVDTAILSKGQRIGFPDWLNWALSTPETVSRDILAGLEKGTDEIYPTLNGKLMLRAHQLFPRMTLKGSRVLLVRRFRDLLLNRYTVD